ncbi:response regulator [Caballeronia concitans]|uniref:Virulence sensor protein BvgS n=1 Tax=Caballeronia concitans TaxID=1777133 RepID=A0A658R0C1_9BURK|nr:response regulator [Caballeronia concitans]KIG10164.1 multi-sensor hybrid histidine kinase [Burkholderia sp. MR1]SAL37223.1 multi-sensor hybrid histidine kinase [Caballeronia concitans]
MPQDNRNHTLWIYFAIALSLAVVFAIDLLTPMRVAIWVFYVLPVVLCMWADRPALPMVTAGGASVLMILGYAFATGDAATTHDVLQVNRAMGIFVLLVLSVVAHLYIKSRLAVQRTGWLQQGIMQMSLQLRGEQSPASIGVSILRSLIPYVNAKVGVVYSLNGDSLERVAAWALPDENGAPRRIARGEGLVGQAVEDKRTLSLSDASAHYLKAGSALGAAAATRVVIAPLYADGDVAGALEIGFVGNEGRFDDARALLEMASEAMGMAMRSARYRTRLVELLEETQRQSEELQVQQEELRVSNEELEERGRALQDSQARLEQQQAELEQTNVQLEEHAQHLERQKTELLHAQQELTANALEMERASQYKSEFLANMSHELRTPLNSSLILAKLLQDNRQGNLTEEQVRYAATIHSSNSDLLSLINDILDLSKVEAGQMDVQFAPAAVESLLQALRQSFAPVAETKGLSFITEVGDDVPQYFVTDSQRLLQVLRNLLANAFKFTERGSVTVAVQRASDDAVRFEVRDTGIGIPRDKQDLIFQAFQQADGTTSRKYGGSGLGLSISREFTRLLGGSVGVSSEVGRGSVFSVTLPLAAREGTVTAKLDTIGHMSEPEPAAVKPPPPPAPATVHMQSVQTQPEPPAPKPEAQGIDDDRANRQRPDRVILVIEDDRRFAHILYDLAHELDFDCVHAASATQGVELARSMQPNGILLDIGLPDQSGLTVLEWLKHDPLTRHIPIHIVSATDHADVALHLGAIGYTLKPSARDELAQAIRKLEARSSQGMRRVLVVEDDPALRQSIHALLASETVNIVEAGSIAQALEQLRRASFDCIVMDLALPDGSGYELLEKVSTSGEFASPPVIVYTGRQISQEEEQRLRRYSKSIIIKGAKSPERLLDEVTLFLHSVESALPPEQQRMLRAARQRDDVFEGRTILLAEDDVRNIFALSRVIEPLGATLEIARNGREALEALARHDSIDLVLMDVMMPEMDGLTAMTEIRKRPEHARLPIIALTAKAMQSDREKCLEAGADDYISKPIDVDKLVSLCRVWLRQR